MTDYTVADTIHFMFTTRRFSTGAPFAIAAGVVSAYENESLTQITAGITLGADHDGVTGLNLVTVVASGANGFEAGKDYHLVITTGTVDSISVVGEVVGRFTLSRSAAAVDLANGTDGLGAIKTDTAAILIDTAEIGVAGAGLTNIDLPNQTMDITGNLSGSVGSVTAGVTVTTNNDKTGYALTASYDFAKGTVAMTESYPTLGATFTPAQALYAINQQLGEQGIAGTTMTVKKRDQVTTAKTYTLDDAVTPTSITEAS